MKNEDQVEEALDSLCKMMLQPGLSESQYTILCGTISALSWVAETHTGLDPIDKILQRGFLPTSEMN